MKPDQVFGIVVRVMGLSLLFYALWYLLYGISSLAGALTGCAADYKVSYFISGFFFLVVSLYLLRGAPLLVRFAYPPDRAQRSSTTPPTGEQEPSPR